MMHMLGADVKAWWIQVVDRQLLQRYGVDTQASEDRPWGIRDFILFDPSSVL